MSVGRTPVPSRRAASVRGPIPASMSNTPAGERRIDALPAEPLARMQSSRDIGLVGLLEWLSFSKSDLLGKPPRPQRKPLQCGGLGRESARSQGNCARPSISARRSASSVVTPRLERRIQKIKSPHDTVRSTVRKNHCRRFGSSKSLKVLVGAGRFELPTPCSGSLFFRT